MIKLSCPVCGCWVHLSQLKSDFLGRKKLSAYLLEQGGKILGENKGRGKAKGKITYKEVSVNSEYDSLEEFWIKVLKNIIQVLELKSCNGNDGVIVKTAIKPKYKLDIKNQTVKTQVTHKLIE